MCACMDDFMNVLSEPHQPNEVHVHKHYLDYTFVELEQNGESFPHHTERSSRISWRSMATNHIWRRSSGCGLHDLHHRSPLGRLQDGHGYEDGLRNLGRS